MTKPMYRTMTRVLSVAILSQLGCMCGGCRSNCIPVFAFFFMREVLCNTRGGRHIGSCTFPVCVCLVCCMLMSDSYRCSRAFCLGSVSFLWRFIPLLGLALHVFICAHTLTFSSSSWHKLATWVSRRFTSTSWSLAMWTPVNLPPLGTWSTSAVASTNVPSRSSRKKLRR